MLRSCKLSFLITLFVLGLKAQAQTGNLIRNGDFEIWDSTKYPLNDGGNIELCKLSNGFLRNEFGQAYNIKGIDCVFWIPYFSETLKYSTYTDHHPIGYKNCYNYQHVSDYEGDTNYQRNGTTFISMNFHFDTLNLKYTKGKEFLYLPLISALKKGKTYQLEFDFKTGRFSDQKFYNIDTIEFYGCKGFGFGFTEKVPTYIQNPANYETDLKPKVSIPYYNEKNWKRNTYYFTADSNYNYIVFGYFLDAKNTHVKSKTPNCQNQYLNEIYCINLIDNIYLQEINDRLLPNDTSVCLGKDVSVNNIHGKPLTWTINGYVLSGKSAHQTIKVNTGLTTVIATDSIVSDTMLITGVSYPQFSITQTDTLCNTITVFVANPNTYTYTWMPDNFAGSTVKLQGNEPRRIMASTKEGCKDTLDFIPVLGNAICGTYYIPNSFTPNGDGLNDFFGVLGTGIKGIEMQIFNAWGEKLFEAYGDNPTWNGQYENNPCPQGVFLYSIKLSYIYNNKIQSEFLKGTFQLMR